MTDKKYSYEDFLAIINQLRSKEGCPWDREQTHDSLKVNLIEECYELVEAIEDSNAELMKEELGDVLLQVVMHAQIAKEEKEFSMEDVVDQIAKKMVHRHPHVFNKEKVDGEISSTQVLINWDKIKSEEKKEKSLVESMDRVAKTLPAVMRTQKVQKKAIKAGQEEVQQLEQLQKIIERLNSMKEKDLELNKECIQEKIGEIMFEVVKLATFFDVNAEFALTKSLEKFINRFRYIENSRVEQ